MLMEKANHKKGMTLIELLAVLGVGGGMVAGALLLVGNVIIKRDIKQHSENLSTIYNNMQNLFSDEPISGSMTQLITAGVFPSTLKITSSTVKTSGGGTVEIDPNSAQTGFNLSYQKIQAETCVDVLKAQKNVGWDKFTVESGNRSADASGGTEFAGSTVASIADECDVTTDWISIGLYID